MTARSLVCAALLLACACEAKPEPKPKPEKPMMPKPTSQEPVLVTWTLARGADGKSLALSYEVENRGGAPIWVLDAIVTTSPAGLVVAPERAIVRRGPDAATASFVIGYTEQPGHAVESQPSPVPQLLAPGAKLSGRKQVPLPLASWHPYDSMIEPLAGVPARAVLEVGFLPKEPPAGFPGWEDVPQAGGGTLHLPMLGFLRTQQKLARGATLAIP